MSRLLEYIFFRWGWLKHFIEQALRECTKKRIETGKKAKPEATIFWTLPKTIWLRDDYNMKCMSEWINKNVWSFFDTLLLQRSLWLPLRSWLSLPGTLESTNRVTSLKVEDTKAMVFTQTITVTTWPVVMLCSRSLVATMQGSSSSASGTNHAAGAGENGFGMKCEWIIYIIYSCQ